MMSRAIKLKAETHGPKDHKCENKAQVILTEWFTKFIKGPKIANGEQEARSIT